MMNQRQVHERYGGGVASIQIHKRLLTSAFQDLQQIDSDNDCHGVIRATRRGDYR